MSITRVVISLVMEQVQQVSIMIFTYICLKLLSFIAISNEQQAGNCNVAVTTLHRLLLHNVYSTNSGVSALSGFVHLLTL